MFERNLFVALALAVAALRVTPASEPIYNAKADAARDIRAALRGASRRHKNVVLVFGANWCGDCHALDQQMHQPGLASLIARNYVMVKIDVGRFDKNLELGEKYHVPVKEKGIPALAVLDPRGKLLYSQDQGQFADARNMDYAAFKAFFEQWKPGRA
jgi:thioredoxin